MPGSDTESDDGVNRQNLSGALHVRQVLPRDERHQLILQEASLDISTPAVPVQSAEPAHAHTSSSGVPDTSLACGVCENCCSILPGPACHRQQAQMVASALPHPGALLALQGASGIGTKIRCWWSADATFYSGVITDFRAKDMAHTITYEDGNVERRQLWGHRIELQLEAGDGTARSAAQKRKCAGGEQSDAMLCGGSDSQEACTAGGAATTLRSFRTRQRKAPASKVRSSAPTIPIAEPAPQTVEEPICISSDEDEEGSESPPLLVPMKVEQAEAEAGHQQLGFRPRAITGLPPTEAITLPAVKPAAVSASNYVSKHSVEPVAPSILNLAGSSREQTVDLSAVDLVHPLTVDLVDQSTEEPALSNSVDCADPSAEERTDPSAEEHADLHEEELADPGLLADPVMEEEPAGQWNDGVSLASSSRQMRSRGSDAAARPAKLTTPALAGHAAHSKIQRDQRMERRQQLHGGWEPLPRQLQQQNQEGEPEEHQQHQQSNQAVRQLQAQPGVGSQSMGDLAATASRKHNKLETRGGGRGGRGGRRGHQADSNGASSHGGLAAKVPSNTPEAWPVTSSPSKTLAEGRARLSWASDFVGVILGHRVPGPLLAAHATAHATAPAAVLLGGSSGVGELQERDTACDSGSDAHVGQRHVRLNFMPSNTSALQQNNPLQQPQPALPGLSTAATDTTRLSSKSIEVQVQTGKRYTVSPDMKDVGDTSITAAQTSRAAGVCNKGASDIAEWQVPHFGTQPMLLSKLDGSIIQGQQQRTAGILHQFHKQPAANHLNLNGAMTAGCMDKNLYGNNGAASGSGQSGGGGINCNSGSSYRVTSTNASDDIMCRKLAVMTPNRAAAEGGGQRSGATDEAHASLGLVGTSLLAAKDSDPAAVPLEGLFGTTSMAGDGVADGGGATAGGTGHGLLQSSVQQLQKRSEQETAPQPPANGRQAAPGQRSTLASTLNHSGIQPQQTSGFHNSDPSVAQTALHARYADQYISTLPQDAARNAQCSSSQVQMHSIQPTLLQQQAVVLLPELDYSKTVNELLAAIGPALRLMTRRLGSSSEKQLAVTEAIVAMDASQRHDLVYLRYAFLKAEFEDGNNDMLRERMRWTFGVDV